MTTTNPEPNLQTDLLPEDDPRVVFASAVALGGDVIGAVRPDQLDDPTPCTDFTVRDLTGHLVAVLRRVAAVGRDEDPFSVESVITDVANDAWLAAWTDAAHDVQAVWTDAAILERPLRLPFATLPGAIAIAIYTNEVTVHTWDLARATGQRTRWDDDVVAVSLAAMQRALPPEPRGGETPFGPVVAVAPDASAIDRLVAWNGRCP